MLSAGPAEGADRLVALGQRHHFRGKLRDGKPVTIGKPWENHRKTICQWIGVRENL